MRIFKHITFPLFRLTMGLCLLPLALSSCDDDVQNEYSSDISCVFNFDITRHAATAIAAAVQPLNYGQFVFVTTELRTVGASPTTTGYTVRYVNSERPTGEKEATAITAADELRVNYVLGAMNGLIIGRSSGVDNTLYAYDRQCPNCMNQYGLYRYAMSFANDGHWVHCSNCRRDYDLNNNGYPVSGGGRKLVRYVAALLTNTNTNTQYLSVHNR